MRAETQPAVDDRFDFSDEEKTKPDDTDMAQLMDSLSDERNELCIPVSTSDRPTKPIRPMVRLKEENGG